MLGFDTGASFILKPFQDDYVDYLECDIPTKNVTKVKKVIWIGTTIHKIKNRKVADVNLLCLLHHIPKSDISLLSPRNYYHMNGGESSIYSDRVEMNLSGREVVVTIDIKLSNIPTMCWLSCEFWRNKDSGFRYRSVLNYSDII